MQFDEASLEALKNDGVLLASSSLPAHKINQIKKDLTGWDQLNFNHQVGSQIIGGNLWIENLGTCSETALKTALDPALLALLDAYFQEKTILGTLKYQKKIIGQSGIPLHSDRGPGIVMFIFLTAISQNTGATRFIKGSHLHDTEFQTEKQTDADYISQKQKTNLSEPFVSEGGPGTILLYSQKTWHDLPSFKKAGREILWAIYYPESKSTQAEDQLFRHNILITLSNEQRGRLFQERPTTGISFTRFGAGTSFIDNYSISAWKIALYVVRYYLIQLFTKLKNNPARLAATNGKISSQARPK